MVTDDDELPREIEELEGMLDPGILFTEVKRAALIRLLDYIRDRALQNHTMHAHWNEGVSADFRDCTRGDCIESRHILTEWEWL